MDRHTATSHVFLAALLVPTVLTVSAVGLAAQERRSADSVEITAGTRYAAGWLHRLLLGRFYRDLWTTPIKVEVLDLGREAGGLTPISAGGGYQTLSLWLRGADGYQYSFRSVDKDPEVVTEELKGTFIEDVVQDQISSQHPAGPAVAAALSEAAGILRAPPPRLVVIPDDPRLDTFRTRFAGALGYFERRTTIEPGVPPFGGAAEIVNDHGLLARVQRDPSNRLDLPAFVNARLFDYFIGDWDRHQGQFTFLRRAGAAGAVVDWVPIPEDRDQAFIRYDGLILALARQYAPQLLNFGDKLPRAGAFAFPGRAFDRRFLVEAEWPTWDSVVTALVARVTDSVIDGAVRRLPSEYYAIDGARLAAALKARRAQLPAKAREYYRYLGEEAEVHGSDADETVVVERRPDGSSDVSVHAAVGAGAEEVTPYWHRRFLRGETRELRIYLYGGNDRVIVRGANRGITLHIVGLGAVEVANASGGGVHLYATEPARTSGRVSVDRRPFTAPPPSRTHAPARDFGNLRRSVTWAAAGPDLGLFLGGGARITDFGFRKVPYASQLVVRGGYSTGAGTGRLDFSADVRRRNSRVHGLIDVRLSGIEVLRYNGLGNEVALTHRPSYYRVNQQLVSVDPALAVPVGPATLVVGPTLTYTRTREQLGRILADVDLYGEGGFGQAGLLGTLELDSRDVAAAATRGVHAQVGGRFFPGLWDVRTAFGEAHGEASTYLTARGVPLRPTLALRVGGKKVWGDYPFQEAAFIGNALTARLGRQNRFGGDAAVYGNAELRLDIGRMFLLLPARFGVLGFADVGRVFLDGESSSKWHTAVGGGVWVAFLGSPNTVSVALARSEGAIRAYGSLGFAF